MTAMGDKPSQESSDNKELNNRSKMLESLPYSMTAVDDKPSPEDSRIKSQ